MDNKPNEIIFNTEDIVKYEIFKFLNSIKDITIGSENDYITLIKGGIIDKHCIQGFLKTKENVYNLMRQNIDNNSKTLHFIDYNNKLRSMNYSNTNDPNGIAPIMEGVKMYDFQAIRNKVLEITTTPNMEQNAINYIRNNIENYRIESY
jgi:hypothetical protein